jgi:hypothetical protein
MERTLVGIRRHCATIVVTGLDSDSEGIHQCIDVQYLLCAWPDI